MRNRGGVLYDNKVPLVFLFSISFFWITSLYDVIFVDDVIKWRHFCQNPTKTKNPITNQPLIVWKWKGTISPHSKNDVWPGLTDPLCRCFADVSTFWAEIAKMTSRDVKWRRHVGFSPKSRDMFLLSILSCGVNMKRFASFKWKLWAF